MLTSTGWLTPLGHGVHCIDTGYQRPQLAAAYLVVDAGEAAFIDTGTARSAERLLAALEHLGLERRAVRWICPTHVHLDHAGGAGVLLQELPQARLVVHPRGARHLVDPGRLEAGVRSVYGDAEFERLFGRIVPAPAARVVEAGDGLELPLGKRVLGFVDTPGHARHHYSVWDPASRGFFTGDSFGLAYPEVCCADRPFVFPTTTPVQFDPEAWDQTLDRYLARRPERMYLTHFGMVGQVPALAADLRRRIAAVAELARGLPRAERSISALRGKLAEYLATELESCGLGAQALEAALRTFAMDLDLNAQGLQVWLQRLDAQAP